MIRISLHKIPANTRIRIRVPSTGVGGDLGSIAQAAGKVEDMGSITGGSQKTIDLGGLS